ncbi:uncharacterized protein N7503_002694 [Penicillium pulvis]|uniref:uncharacterized protein n=1 Tax=Penicillium pulvis TaxID=1562058 RepID=UPI002546D1E2|nr:uncharacterized protein N7503_002694 [Penicillium pulvis]KAJ5810476.1 hypothetical protein N7503_002694 [Penicillium pulvis]
MDHHAQSILAQFDVLSPQNRQLVYHGILDHLRRSEWREVKLRADRINFEYDLLGKLPLEIVAMVAEHLNIADLILLQRVSQQWRRVLSSPMVQSAAIRAIVGSDVPVLDSKQVIQKRLRLERAKQVKSIHLPFSPIEHNNTPRSIREVGYSHGIYAQLDTNSGLTFTSIIVLHLCNGREARLTTENREDLIELRISKSLIAAISTRAYCHIWDLNTHEHRSFRISSLDFEHFVVHDRNVAFGYRGSVIHWGWKSSIARHVPIKTRIVLLALHPLEDQFTIVRFSEEVFAGDELIEIDGMSCQVHAEKYTIDNANGFHCSLSQDRKFSLIEPGDIHDLFHAQEIYEGQSSNLLVRLRPSTGTKPRQFFSLEGDEVMVHTLPALPSGNIVCVGQDLTYFSGGYKTVIMESKYRRHARLSNVMSECQYPIQREVEGPSCYKMFADQDFAIFFNGQSSEIWGFDETWNPAEWPIWPNP